MRGVLVPGGDRALIWRPHDALLLLRSTTETTPLAGHSSGPTRGNSKGCSVERHVSRATSRIAAMCSDSWGWFAFVSDEGDVSVWSAEDPGPAPAQHLSATSALRSRHAAENGPTPAATAALNVNTRPAEASKEGGMVSDGLHRERVDVGSELESNGMSEKAAAMAVESGGKSEETGGLKVNGDSRQRLHEVEDGQDATVGKGGGTAGGAGARPGNDMCEGPGAIPAGYETLARWVVLWPQNVSLWRVRGGGPARVGRNRGEGAGSGEETVTLIYISGETASM